eukprot:SAG31_NODE_4101_length_3583_cov_1.895522_5_plen_39_part_00
MVRIACSYSDADEAPRYAIYYMLISSGFLLEALGIART